MDTELFDRLVLIRTHKLTLIPAGSPLSSSLTPDHRKPLRMTTAGRLGSDSALLNSTSNGALRKSVSWGEVWEVGVGGWYC